ncbi:Bromo adjacent y [Mactra antiquata]
MEIFAYLKNELISSATSSTVLTVPMFTLSSSSSSSVSNISSSSSTTLANSSSQSKQSSSALSSSSVLSTNLPATSHNTSSTSSPSRSSLITKQPVVQSLIKQDASTSKTSPEMDQLTSKHKTSSTNVNEPLNLTVATKSDEKQITSSLFGVVPDQKNVKTVVAGVTGSRSSVTHSTSPYKTAHPIGSRKVTENVITYHEPMFQSVANSLFENQKNLNMGKRKNEDERNKGDCSSPDLKKRKTDGSGTPSVSKSPVTSPVKSVKKKSIENIIQRIRTEKTASRSSVVTALFGKSAEADAVEVGCSENTGTESSNSDYDKVTSTTNSKDVPKTDSTVKVSSEVSVVSSSTNSPDNQKVTSTTNTLDLESDDSIGNDNTKTEENKVSESKLSCENRSEKVNNKSVKKDNEVSVKNEDINNDTPRSTSSSNSKQSKTSAKKSEGKLNKPMCEKSDSKSKKKSDIDKKMGKSKSLSDYIDRVPDKKSKKKKDLSDSELNDTKNSDKKKQKVKSESDVEGLKKSPKKKISKEDNEMKPKTAPKKENVSEDTKKKVKKKNEDDTDSSETGKKKSAATKKKGEIETKAKTSKDRKKPKLSIAGRRVKREASLNAAMFLNILNESPRAMKLESQRSKSDSDLKSLQTYNVQSSQSMSNINLSKSDFGNVDKSKIGNILEGQNFELKLTKAEIPEGLVTPKKDSKQVSKTPSPKRKVSFSDDVFDSVFEAVIQRSIDETDKGKSKSDKTGTNVKKSKASSEKSEEKKHLKLEKMKKDTKPGNSDKNEKKFRLDKIKKAVKLAVTKSPEEIAEKKRKAYLTRLERAKEIRKTERKVSERAIVTDDKYSDDSMSVSSDRNDDELKDETETEQKDDEVKKIKAKKGALFRAARTHVLVESKTVVENTMPSPRWCECCQSSYNPSQPTQGAQVWRIKQLVDKDSTKSPEPIQSSSNHFIAAHASCEVRPYASPSHVSVIDSSPYVGQIVQHGHIQCSPCSCGHSGVFHHGQCQNCTLGGVSNILPCQRYSNTYSVTYPHTHGSYTHCGCGACYPAGSYHHTVGKTLIHQPQMPISTESPILLHHPVQLQVTHDTSHSVSMATMPHSHTESGHSHSLQSVPLPRSHNEQSLSHLTHMCQLSQGEVTNMSVIGSNSPSDYEIVDVGSRDDIMKALPSSSQMSTESFYSAKNDNKSNKDTLKMIPTDKKKKSKTDEVKKGGKIVDQKNKDTSLKKNDKKSRLLLIKQKQKQLELKSLKVLQKKDSKNDSNVSKETKKQVKDRTKSCDTKSVSKDASKVKKSKSCEPKLDDSLNKEQNKRAWHGWSWDGEGVMKKITNIFDGQSVQRRCYNGIIHEDGDTIQVKDCVLVCSGRKEKDIPYVAKVSNFWEDPSNGEMMMSVLWFYRPEHAEGGRIYGNLENEVFAAKHRDETLVACIEDRGFVLTYNEYCRFMAEVERTKHNLPTRKKVVPDPEESYPSNRIPPVDINPENVFLCRQVYDIKLKRVLKNPS